MSYLVTEQFLKKQEEIYQRFESQAITALAEGLTPDKVTVKPSIGIFVVFRHEQTRAEELEQLSVKISQELGATTLYRADAIHTTITFLEQPEMSKRLNIVKQLLPGLTEAVKETVQPLNISYNRFLHNQSTVIAAGMPDSSCMEFLDRIFEQWKSHGEEPPEPWGAHITLARVHKACDPEQAQLLSEILVATGCPFESRLRSVDIGHAEIGLSNRLNVTRSFELP